MLIDQPKLQRSPLLNLGNPIKIHLGELLHGRWDILKRLSWQWKKTDDLNTFTLAYNDHSDTTHRWEKIVSYSVVLD